MTSKTKAGIVVHTQISDERKWFLAMERIQKEFEGQPYFTILPNFNKEAFSSEVFDKLKETEDMNFCIEGSKSIVSDWKLANGKVFHKIEP